MSKVLDAINEKYAEKIFAEKIDISEEENRSLAYEFKVMYIPHLLFVNAKGEVFNQKIGFLQEEDVLAIFEEAGIKIR